MEDVYLYLAIASFALAAISLVACIVIFFRAGVPDAIRFLQHKPLKNSGNGSLRVIKPRAGMARQQPAASAPSSGDSRTSPINTGGEASRIPTTPTDKAVRKAQGERLERAVGRAEDTEAPTDLLDEESTERPTDFLRAEEDSEMPTGLLVGQDDTEAPTSMLIDEQDAEDPTGLLVEQDAAEDPTGLLGEGGSEDPTSLLAAEAAPAASVAESPKPDEPASQGEDGADAAGFAKKPGGDADAASDGANEGNAPVEQYGDGDFRFILKQNVVVVHTDEVIGD